MMRRWLESDMIRTLDLCVCKLLWRDVWRKTLHCWVWIYWTCPLLLRWNICDVLSLYGWFRLSKIIRIFVYDIGLRIWWKHIGPKIGITCIFVFIKVPCPNLFNFSYWGCLTLVEPWILSSFIFNQGNGKPWKATLIHYQNLLWDRLFF